MKSPIPSRHINWPNCYNTRDLGGLPTVDGEEIRRQSIIRSDILNRLTIEGWQALLDYGVRTIIDLRRPDEVEAEPPVFNQQATQFKVLAYFNLSLDKGYPHVNALLDQATSQGEVYCLILDHYPDAVASVLRAIAAAQPGGVVIHCHAGKDRTGIISALLLSLAGVQDEIVAADFAESQARLWPLYEKIVMEAGGEDRVASWLKPITTEAMIITMFNHITTKYDGVEHYLRASGLSFKEIRQIKSRLLFP
jgi:protein-tyrosine phosphatase